MISEHAFSQKLIPAALLPWTATAPWTLFLAADTMNQAGATESCTGWSGAQVQQTYRPRTGLKPDSHVFIVKVGVKRSAVLQQQPAARSCTVARHASHDT